MLKNFANSMMTMYELLDRNNCNYKVVKINSRVNDFFSWVVIGGFVDQGKTPYTVQPTLSNKTNGVNTGTILDELLLEHFILYSVINKDYQRATYIKVSLELYNKLVANNLIIK